MIHTYLLQRVVVSLRNDFITRTSQFYKHFESALVFITSGCKYNRFDCKAVAYHRSLYYLGSGSVRIYLKELAPYENQLDNSILQVEL